MARGSRGLSQISSNQKWQEVQGDLAKFPQNENGKRFKGTLLQKKGGGEPNRREGFSPSPLQRGREKKLSAAARHPPEPKERTTCLADKTNHPVKRAESQ